MLNFAPKNFSQRFVSLLLAVALLAFVATPAFADGELPPTPPEETAPAEEQAPVEEAPAEESAAEAEAPILEDVPEGTDVVVLNEEGEQVPLASEEGAALIIAGDPIWCPAGVAPVALTSGCSDSYGSMGDLLAGFVPTGNGTIWVQSGMALAGVNIDGAGTWSAAASYNLAVQGGWDGVSGSTALDVDEPTSTFSGENTDWLWITNWTGNISLNNLIFDSFGYDYVQSAENATLYVETTGNIALNNVSVNNASNSDASGEHDGALLDNTSGNGSVTVSNSSFAGNEGSGLTALSSNTITLNNVSASLNGDNGASLNNTFGGDGKSVKLSGTNTFEYNNFLGLEIFSSGDVLLNNLNATGNGLDGVWVDNTTSTLATDDDHNHYCWWGGHNNGDDEAGSVTLTGNNKFEFNGTSGLSVFSAGDVALNNLIASNNGGLGVYVDNTFAATTLSTFSGSGFGWGGWGHDEAEVGSVSLTGSGLFNGNGEQGLYILTNGSVTTKNLSALYNGDEGVYVDNSGGESDATVALNGNNLFEGNGWEGLSVLSSADVKVNNITAQYNGGHGVMINNGAGLLLFTTSGGYYGGSSDTSSVSITGTNLFDSNGLNGIAITSDGTITMNNVTAQFNGLNGAMLDNSTGSFGGYTSKCSYKSSQTAVSLTGKSRFEGNGSTGLNVLSAGDVSLNSITAIGNGIDGVLVNNTFGANADVTMTGTNLMQDNVEDGMQVLSSGDVNLSNLTNKDNGGDGLMVSTLGKISLYKVVATGNGFLPGHNGIQLTAGGSITVSCSSASGNAGYGLAATTPGKLTLKAFSATGNTTGQELLVYGQLYRTNSGCCYW